MGQFIWHIGDMEGKMFKKRISIFTGHFGSGKTEVAVNYALKLSEMKQKTAIVDFDIVNPYFRTTDVKNELENYGLWVVTPLYANTNIDVPALPPEINTLFERKDYSVVLDVGGDDLGAKVLSRYREEILQDDYEMYFVVNTRRPMTDSIPKIEEMIADIEYSSRLKITSLVDNTNILQYTTVENIINGHKIIDELSGKLGIPVGFISGMDSVIGQLEDRVDTPMLKMRKLIRLPWDLEGI
jgi:tRNA uridine 5-carbamoylmethylation protein Kti12